MTPSSQVRNPQVDLQYLLTVADVLARSATVDEIPR